MHRKHPYLQIIGYLAIISLFSFNSLYTNNVEYVHQKVTKNINKNVNIKAQQLIKQMAMFAYDSYHKNAFPHDIYDPILSKPLNIYDENHSFWFTAVDSLDTMQLMGLKDRVTLVKNKISELEFKIDINIPCIPFSRRLLGGLLGIFYLEQSPIFLSKAVDFMELAIPLISSNSIPNIEINLSAQEVIPRFQSLSDMTSFQIELIILSKYTTDTKYKDIADKIRLNFHKSVKSVDSLKIENSKFSFNHFPKRLNKSAIKYVQMLITLYQIEKDENLLIITRNTLDNIINKHILINANMDYFVNTRTPLVIEQQVNLTNLCRRAM